MSRDTVGKEEIVAMRSLLRLLRRLGLKTTLEKFNQYVAVARRFGVKFGGGASVNAMKKVIVALAERKPYAVALPNQIRVYNSFPVRDELKKLGYRFDGFLRVWYKKVPELGENSNYLLIHTKKINEVEKLKELGIPVITVMDEDHLKAFAAKVEEGVI